MSFEYFFDLFEDFIFGLIFANDVDYPAQYSTNIFDGSFLEVLGDQDLYSYWVSTSLSILRWFFLLSWFIPLSLFWFRNFSVFSGLYCPMFFLLKGCAERLFLI